jgi:alpha/beta superfamily hydrolase
MMLSLGVVAVLAACGTVQQSVPTSTPTKPTPTPTVPSQSVSFVDKDGVMLYGTLYGQGKRAIILSNEGDNDPTSWVPVAVQLASRGYLVLGFAYRSEDNTDAALAAHTFADLRAAVTFVHTRNVTGITLMGSSLGGLLAVKAATSEKFDAVVAISAPIEYQDLQLSDAELHRLSSPKLFVTSDQNDPFTGDTLHMYDTTPAPKEKQVYAGRHHGIALFQDHLKPELLSVLLQFLQHYVPAR